MAALKNCPVIFVTGTDTGVGKTLVTAALAHHFSSKGLKVGVMKPVETGVQNLDELGDDGALLCWAAGSKDPLDVVSPYRFTKPMAPCQAATSAGVKIDAKVIQEAFHTLRKDKDLILIEGAGGLMVPVTGGFLMSDLAQLLEASLLVITHPRLGTLNHTLLTTFAARSMELPISGFIVNQMPEAPGEVEAQAPHLLASLASANILGVLPEVTGSGQDKVLALSEAIDALPAYSWLTIGLGIDL